MTPAEILNEFRRKYEGTYVFVQMPDSTEENLFHMQAVTAAKASIGTMTLVSEDYGKIQLNLGTAHTIKFKFPKVGVFQHGADAMLFLRDPQRQWQRGLCNANCVIRNVATHITTSFANKENLTYEKVADAFRAKQYSFPEAVKMIQSGNYRSVAMADLFSLMLAPCKNMASLLMWETNPIASLNANGEVIQILEPVFEPNIKKILQ